MTEIFLQLELTKMMVMDLIVVTFVYTNTNLNHQLGVHLTQQLLHQLSLINNKQVHQSMLQVLVQITLELNLEQLNLLKLLILHLVTNNIYLAIGVRYFLKVFSLEFGLLVDYNFMDHKI